MFSYIRKYAQEDKPIQLDIRENFSMLSLNCASERDNGNISLLN